jgi:hypothetical protein
MPRHPPRALVRLTYSKTRALRGASFRRGCGGRNIAVQLVRFVLPALAGPAQPPASAGHGLSVGGRALAFQPAYAPIGLMYQADGADDISVDAGYSVARRGFGM